MNIVVNGQLLTVTDDTLVSNSVGIYECEFTFDESWDGFDKTSVWKLNSDDPIEVVITNGKAVIPHEVLVNAGFLRIGVYGTKDEKVMPTVWLETRKVCLGTPTGSIGTEPTPSIYAQILAVAENAVEVAEGVANEWSNVSAEAESLAEGESATASYSDGVFTFGIPQGESGADGTDGFSPIVAVTPITNGHRVTITDAEGVHTFDVLDGTDGADGVGITNIVMNADYTLTITLSNGTSYTTPSIRGEQGEKGETGNGIASVVKTGTVGLVDTYTITFTDGSTTTFEVTNGAEGRSDFASYLPIDSASGTIASFTDGAEDIPVESCVVTLAPIQDTSSGDPSPTNICPISGHDEVVVRQTGVNVWDEEWEVGAINSSTGAKEVNYVKIRSKNYIPIVPNTPYYYTNLTVGINNYANIYFYDGNKNYIGEIPMGVYAGTSTSNANYHNPFTTPTNASYMMFSVTNGYGTTYKNDISVNYPSTDHDYHPYNGDTYPISLGRTVYGGVLDVTSGVLTVTHKSRTFNGGDSWNGSNIGTNANLSISDMLSGNHYSDTLAICDSLPKVSVISGDTPEVRIGASNTSVYLYNMKTADASITSSATLNTYLVNHPITITYPLATPTTITLTPQEIATFKSANNIWSDNGTISVTYRADIQGYIDKKISALATL